MKTIELKQNYSREDILEKLKQKYPAYKINTPLLASKVISITKGTIATSITVKNNIIIIKGTVNFAHIGIALGVAIGILFGFIGGFIFAGIIYLVKKKDFIEMEDEFADFIKSSFL